MINDFAINGRDNNQPANQNNSEPCLRKISKHTTFLFTFLSIMMTIIYLSTLIFKLKISDFSLCSWPVYNKRQYYRLLTHNFFHLNFVHIASNLLFFYVVGKELEKKLGTAIFSTIIIQSSILVSIAYLMIVALLKYFLVELINFTEYNYDFYCSAGFSAILFTLLYIKSNFKNVVDSYVMMFGIIPIRSWLIPYTYLVLIQLLIPNSSCVGHLSGIITGAVIKYFLVYFTFPRKEWINEFENGQKGIIEFMKFYLGYVDLELINVTDLEDVDEFDKGIMDFIFFKCVCNFFRRRNGVNHINQINETARINL